MSETALNVYELMMASELPKEVACYLTWLRILIFSILDVLTEMAKKSTIFRYYLILKRWYSPNKPWHR
jgi:hypothetical protein